jgi:chromosome partitioning protein
MAANPETLGAEITLTEARQPIGSEGVADLARRAADLNKTIRDLATHPNHRKTLRKFVGSEVAALLDLKVETLYRRLDRNPNLPQGMTTNPRRREFTLEEAFTLRRAFNLTPKRVPGQPGIVLSVCNFKGGVAKTTTS